MFLRSLNSYVFQSLTDQFSFEPSAMALRKTSSWLVMTKNGLTELVTESGASMRRDWKHWTMASWKADVCWCLTWLRLLPSLWPREASDISPCCRSCPCLEKWVLRAYVCKAPSTASRGLQCGPRQRFVQLRRAQWQGSCFVSFVFVGSGGCASHWTSHAQRNCCFF